MKTIVTFNISSSTSSSPSSFLSPIHYFWAQVVSTDYKRIETDIFPNTLKKQDMQEAIISDWL